MSKYRRQDGANPFEMNSMEEADNAIFSGGKAMEDLADQRLVARPTPLDEIWADVRQPRRAIPMSIRLHWGGDPDEIMELLNQWGMIAKQYTDLQIDERKIITGDGDGFDTEGLPAIVDSYVSLLRLAQDIHRVGLTNPISIVKQSNRYLIESGERRYLAHQLLAFYTGDDKYKKIPAIVSDGKDFVWRQASENTARRQLNAIGMARQLALLIMDARKDIDGVRYEEYERMVLPGGCDRRFYAQVSDGNVHRIPSGMAERIQSAMSLSEKRIADYRRLLKLTGDDEVNDALWVRADVEDWSERALRDLTTLPMGKVREIISHEGWTLDDLREIANEAKEEATPEPEEPKRTLGVPPKIEPIPHPRGWYNDMRAMLIRTVPIYKVDPETRVYVPTSERVPAMEEVKYLEAFSSGPNRLAKIWRDKTTVEVVIVPLDALGTQERKYESTPPAATPPVSTPPTVDNDEDADIDVDPPIVTLQDLPDWDEGQKLVLMTDHHVWAMVPNGAYEPTERVLEAGEQVRFTMYMSQKTETGREYFVMATFGKERIVLLPYDLAPLWSGSPASDNDHSQAPDTPESIEGNAVLAMQYGAVDILDCLYKLSEMVDADSSEAIRWLFMLKQKQALELAKKDELSAYLNEVYETIMRMMTITMEEHIAQFMDRIETGVKKREQSGD